MGNGRSPVEGSVFGAILIPKKRGSSHRIQHEEGGSRGGDDQPGYSNGRRQDAVRGGEAALPQIGARRRVERPQAAVAKLAPDGGTRAPHIEMRPVPDRRCFIPARTLAASRDGRRRDVSAPDRSLTDLAAPTIARQTLPRRAVKRTGVAPKSPSATASSSGTCQDPAMVNVAARNSTIDIA